MKRFTWKIALIIGATLAGLYCMWPPEQKLKLGIDLSGGTILVYEVVSDNTNRSVNMEELIAALKKRADPEGVKEIPIRNVGGNRIEIILPQASNEEVEEVKKMLTDVGSLEFRILANHKHDSGAIQRALGPGGLAKPALRLQVGADRRGLDRHQPSIRPRIRHRPPAGMEERPVRGNRRLPDREGLRPGSKRPSRSRSARNTTNTLILDKPHGLKSIASYRIEYNPSQIHAGDPSNPRPSDVIIREEKVADGRTETWILCNLDRPGQEVTGKYLKQVKPDVDEGLQPAVRFEFDARGASRFGRLTHEHRPEEGGSFQYQLAIVLDNLVMSAPHLKNEIRDSGIIEGGPQGFKAKEVEHLVQVLRAGSLPASLNPTPVQEEKVGPTLGEDTIAKGVFAIWVSLLVVPIFMVIYYRFAGFVAVLALLGQYDSPDRIDGVHPGDILAPRAGGARAHDRYGRRRQRARLRANARGKRTRGESRSADPQWIQPSLGHDLRLARHQLPRRTRALHRRHRAGQGLRAHDDDRHGLEPVHRRLHVASDLRGLLHQRLAQEDHDAQDPRQDQHRLRRPALLLHGRLGDLDRAGFDRNRHTAGRACSTSTSPAAPW